MSSFNQIKKKNVKKIGINKEEIDYLGKEGHKCKKCSRRDISECLVKKLNGSTTVAATMIFAQFAGIKIFVTGGIGGVHRGAETTFDVSADLIELGQTQVIYIIVSFWGKILYRWLLFQLERSLYWIFQRHWSIQKLRVCQ